MRNAVLVILMYLACGLVAQPYIPLLDTSATWQDNYHSVDLSTDRGYDECYVYRLGADTLVNDTAYTILRRTGRFDSRNVYPPYNFSTTWYAGSIAAFLREDSAARKVFVLLPNWPYELLLYDFSVGVGPYPWTYRYPYFDQVEVTSVDSLILIDGPHRRMTFASDDQLIEGVGFLRGFMPAQSTSNIFWAEPQLVCHNIHGSQDYETTYADNYCLCGSNVDVPSLKMASVRISPSPTTTLCQLEGAPPNAPFMIRSMDGQLVGSGACSSTGSATIDMAALPSAMYMVLVAGPAGSLIAKIMKE